MTIETALRQGTELLTRAEVFAPKLTAEVLLCHALGQERSYLYAHPERELREVEWLHYGRYLHERMEGKPTQYITKTQEFYGREFRVTPNVLIPRPETELLVETVLKLRRRPGRVIDVGTGSGAIAVTVALEAHANVIATDLSERALSVATANAMRLGAPVALVCADLLSALDEATIDVVVCNPPYVPSGDRVGLQREVRDWEPSLALFAGPNGLEIYERLLPDAWRVLKSGGLLAVELGFGLAEHVSSLIANRWRGVEIFPDLAGIPRVLVCEKP